MSSEQTSSHKIRIENSMNSGIELIAFVMKHPKPSLPRITNHSINYRELISDEAIGLKQRNDILLSEFSIAQQDVIKAGQLMNQEQGAVLSGKLVNAC